jgi:hypothetical protein
MNPRAYKSVSIVVPALMVFLILAASGCEFSFSTAKLSEAVMCLSVNEDTKKPIGKTDVFSSDTPEIFCSVRLSHAPADTTIKSEWIYVKGEVEDLTDYTIDEFSLTAEGTSYVSFSLTRPNTGFPKGDYMLKLLMDDEEKIALSFRVE